MKANEFLPEARKKKVVEPTIPWSPEGNAFERLMSHKEDRSNIGAYQLFMPRKVHGRTSYQKHLMNIANKYATDDEGNVKPQYQAWADKHPDKVTEAAPIIAARNMVPPGNNKPSAIIWTSSARRLNNGTYTSDWVRWVSGNQSDWMSDVGYLYKVSPQATLLQMDSDYTAREIYDIFASLGRVEKEPESGHGDNYDFRRIAYKNYPWDSVSKHFDGVHHTPYSRDNEFLYGWDCESTAWFNADCLTLIGEVKINQNGLSPYDNDDE